MQKAQSDIASTIKHASIYAAVSILEKAVGFVMLPFYAHLLGTDGYGIIGMLEVVTSILSVLVSYGIASAINRFYFERATEKERSILVSTALLSMLLITTFVCFPCIALNEPIAYLTFGTKGSGIYIILAVVSFMADATGYAGQQYFLIRQQSILMAVFAILRLFLALSLNIYLILILRLGILGVLYSQLVTSIIFSALFQVYTLFHTGIHFSKDDAKEIIQFSLPLLPGYLAVFVRANADKVIIRSMLGLSEIGVYSMVLKFSVLIGLFIFQPFMKTWIPKRMEICDAPTGPETISKMVTIHLSMMIFTGLFLALELPMLLEILTPSEFWVSSIVGFIAIFSRIAFNSYYHFIFGLLYGKKTFYISVIQIVVALISIPMYLLLITHFGIAGAFTSALMVFMIQCVSAWYWSRPYYSITYEWRKIIIALSSAVFLFILISPINLKHTLLAGMIMHNGVPIINKLFVLFGLDSLKEGMLMVLFTEKIIVIFEGLVKGILSMIYLILLILTNVIPKDKLCRYISVTVEYIRSIGMKIKRAIWIV